MKKLMTMLAAAAMAFGLYADGAYEQKESFEDGFTVDGTTWATNAADTAAVEVRDYVDGDEPTHVPDAFTDGVGSKYLAVKTELKADGTKGLSYAFDDKTTKEIGEGVYFDGLVNFTTACDETTVEVDGGVKLVAYAVDMGEVEGGTAGQTNLFITAGYWNAAANEGEGAWEAKAYNCGQLRVHDMGSDLSGFYRLTIRAMANISENGSVPGFVVFVNGEPAQRLDPADGIGYTDLNSTAAAWNVKRNLFPSLDQDVEGGYATKIAGITVAGQGLIDCFALTRNCPGFAEDRNFTLEKDEHITSFKYQVNSGDVSEAITANSVSIPLTGEAMTVTISDIVYVTGGYEEWGEGDWEGDTYVTPNAATKTFSIEANAENCTGKMVSKDVAERILVDGVYYATFADAIEALKTATDKTLTLNQNVTVDFDEDSGNTEAFIESENDVTLDLAGNILTSKTGAAETTYVVMCQCPNFTIKDSKGGGKIVALEDEAGAVAVGNCKLIVEGGIFDGAVVLVPGTTADASIKGGKFASDNDQAFYLHGFLADGFEEEYAEGYWTVKPMTPATVALTLVHATVEGVKDEAEVYEGDTIEFTAAAAEYYDDEKIVVTINGAPITPEEGTYTYEVQASDIGSTIAINVSASPIAWTISYRDGEEGDYTEVSNETYTIESRLTQALWDGTREGYTKDNDKWSDADGYDVDDNETYLAGKTGLVALYNTWTEEAKDVTITLPTLPITGVDSLVVSQKVNDVWTLVEDNKIGIGNEYVVIAIPADGYRAENPIVEGTAEADIEIKAEDVAAKVKQYVVQIEGGDQYTSFAAAFAAAQDGDTITFLENFTGEFFTSNLVTESKFATGLTIDLNDKTWTLTGTAAQHERLWEDRMGNSFLIMNGSLTAVPDADTPQSIAFYTYAETFEFRDVTLDFSALAMGDSADPDDPRKDVAIVSQNGSVMFTGSTTVTLAENQRLVTILDRAGAKYEPGTLTLDVGGELPGDILLYSACTIAVGKGTTLSGKVYTGAANCSGFEPAGALGSPFVALVGKIVPATESTLVNTRGGELFTSLEAANAAIAAATDKNIIVLKPVTVDSFTVAADTVNLEIPANVTFEATTLDLNGAQVKLDEDGTLTAPGLTEDDFVAPAEGWKLKNVGDTWTIVAIKYATVEIATVANCTIAVTNGDVAVESGAKFDIDDAVTLDVYRVPAEGYKLADGCLAHEQIALGEEKTYEITAAVEEAPAEKDPTEDDPTQIPDTEKASDRYGEKVPTTLANVSAKSIATWAQNNGKLEKGAEILENAFLLNCENTEAAINAAKENFKATSITVDSDGKVTVGTPDGALYNGTIKTLGKAELKDAEWSEDLEGKSFFELKLVPTNLE